MAYDHGAFRVRNLETSIQFYVEKLGFTLLWTHRNESYGERTAFLDYNGARLELIETLGETYEPQQPKRPFCPHLCFNTDDMEQVLETLHTNGITILDGPNEIPGSETWVYFADPDWNVLEYIKWYK